MVGQPSWRMSTTRVESDTGVVPAVLEFTYSRFYRYFLAFGAVLFAASAVAVFVQQTGLERYSVAGLVVIEFVFVGFALLSFYGFYSLCKRIQISESSITEVNLFGRSQSIALSEVSEVRSRSFLKRLDLLNEDRVVAVKVDFQINGFAEILAWLKAQRPDLWERASTRTEFKRAGALKLYVLGSSLFFWGLLAVLGLSAPMEAWELVVLIALGCLGPVALITEIQSISLESSSMLLRYPFREKRVYYSDIEDVQLEHESGQYGSRHVVTTIYLRSGKQLKLGGFKGGDIELSEALMRRAQPANLGVDGR